MILACCRLGWVLLLLLKKKNEGREKEDALNKEAEEKEKGPAEEAGGVEALACGNSSIRLVSAVFRRTFLKDGSRGERRFPERD